MSHASAASATASATTSTTRLSPFQQFRTDFKANRLLFFAALFGVSTITTLYRTHRDHKQHMERMDERDSLLLQLQLAVKEQQDNASTQSRPTAQTEQQHAVRNSVFATVSQLSDAKRSSSSLRSTLQQMKEDFQSQYNRIDTDVAANSVSYDPADLAVRNPYHATLQSRQHVSSLSPPSITPYTPNMNQSPNAEQPRTRMIG